MTFRTEAEFQSAVAVAARRLGLLIYHPNNPRRDARGFPDLVIVGDRGTLFRELKTDTGKLRPEQVTWLDRLANGGADVAVWRPSDWPEHIVEQLREIA